MFDKRTAKQYAYEILDLLESATNSLLNLNSKFNSLIDFLHRENLDDVIIEIYGENNRENQDNLDKRIHEHTFELGLNKAMLMNIVRLRLGERDVEEKLEFERVEDKRRCLDSMYEKVLVASGLNRHPKELSYKDRIMQYRILNQAAEDPEWLPINQFHWEIWHRWHLEENKTEHFGRTGE